jgi:type II secretory pathway pseudopilin PulG
MKTDRTTNAFLVRQTVPQKEPRDRQERSEAGFTLFETTIALVVMMIAALGAASVFSYSINYNSGGSDRLVALAIAQEQLELMRSAQFNSTITDTILTGGTSSQSGVVRMGKRYVVTTTIDDNPATADPDVIATTTLKHITVAVAPENVSQGWSLNAGATVSLITQRARSDR